jgi:heme exporter protein D
MQFESFADFVALGKHGVFVWSCYAAFVVIVAINVVAPIARRKQLISRLQRIERRQAGASSPRPAR